MNFSAPQVIGTLPYALQLHLRLAMCRSSLSGVAAQRVSGAPRALPEPRLPVVARTEAAGVALRAGEGNAAASGPASRSLTASTDFEPLALGPCHNAVADRDAGVGFQPD